MIYKILLIIFYAIGATFDFYMYKDTGDKGFFNSVFNILARIILKYRKHGYLFT